MTITAQQKTSNTNVIRSRASMMWTLVLASIGGFITSLDVVAVSTALPSLKADFGASLADLEWTINAYNLAFACLMLTGAALGDRFGRRRMYVVGLGVFTAASAAGALSTSVDALILARIVQGAGAAMVLPLTLSLISAAFPAERRGGAIGIWCAITGLGVALGPVLGGALTEGFAWQWIFWINVPVGLAAAYFSATRLRESNGPRPQLDISGLILAAAGLLGLTWAPVRAPVVGWTSTEVFGALVVGVAFLGAFLVREGKARYPMLPLHYFKVRGFTTANGVAFFQNVSLIGSLFMIAQLFQIGMGDSPLDAGLKILVWTGMPMLVAPIAGALSDKVGNRPFMFAGLLLQGIGLGWLALVVEPGIGYGSLVVPLILAGIGISMCFPTVAGAVVASLPVSDAGVAAGANNAVREVGGVFGVAILSAVFAASGSYASSASFISGFKAAEWVAAAISIVGTVWAVLAPRKISAAAR